MHASRVVFIAGVILAGCGGMMTDSVGMRDIADEARAETSAYHSAELRLTTLPAMVDESTHHTSRMDTIFDDMGTHMMGAMGHCSSVPSMMDLRDDMHAELVAHDATMHMMTTMDDARADVEHHVTTMTVMLDRMDAMLDSSHCPGW